MTENKRFTYDPKSVSLLIDGEIWLDGNVDTACNHKEICDLLNEQDGEIKELSDTLENMVGFKNKYRDKYKQLKKENEQLKQSYKGLQSELQIFKEDVEHSNRIINKLNDENEQLKKELKRCKEWLNSDKYDYETTLSFIKHKGYSLKDVLEYKKGGDVE